MTIFASGLHKKRYMKRILLHILLALCFVPSQAQNSPTGDIYYGVVKWGDRKLRWDDFRAKNPKNGKTSSYVGLVAKPKPKTKIVDGIKYKYTDWENFVIQKESWMDANNMNESKLKHCQNQFDLWEYLVRKVAVDYPRKQDVSLDMQYYEMQKTFDAEIDRMNKLTNHGNNSQAVDSIADELAKELSEKELDPRDIVKGYEPSKVYWMSDAGLVVNVPFSGYASPAFGFSGGVSYNRKRFLYGFDFDMTFGKCNKQILKKKGHIEDGDWLYHGGMTLYFGYNAYNRNKKSFTPFIGAGVRFFYGGDKYEEYQPEKVNNNLDKKLELVGFSVGFGVMADFKVKHTVNMSYKLPGMESTETQIRVKPYFSLTNYGKPVGWTPALNICVGVNGKTYRLKKSEQAQKSNDDIHLGMVKWGERKLRWDDFKAVNPMKGKTSSYVSLKMISMQKEKILDGIKYKYIGRENYAIQGQSWIDTKNMNESKLKHCQNQFDLWEFLVRKVAVESEKQGVDFDKQYLQRAFDEEIERMNNVTSQGNNAQAVDSIADELAKKLTDEEFDPRDMTRGLEPSKVYWMGDMGIIASVPFSDYQGTSYGVSFGASYNRCKRLYGLDIDLSFFSKCKKQILAKKGHIDEGDWLTCGAITSYFGYNIYNRNKVALTPFIGAGVRFFDGGERYEEYKEKNNVTYECAGFSTGLGLMIDYKLKHTINLQSFFRIATETQLRVKPYFNITKYNNGIGWVPAINIAVGINTKTYRMWEKY